MGTIMVELVLRVPFLAGESDLDQLKKTFHAMGTPTEQDWPVSVLLRSPFVLMYSSCPPPAHRHAFPWSYSSQCFG